MKPANTELARIDLGTPALRWPEMERVAISLQSPDEQGAVAYYFDTLVEASQIGNIELVGRAGKAACAYLLGLVQTKGLQLVRGPFLTMAPDHGPLPDGWWMVRAVVWVEEFDHLVPVEPGVVPDEPSEESGHLISIRDADKTDATGLHQAVCSCGRYRSMPTTRGQAQRAGRQHIADVAHT